MIEQLKSEPEVNELPRQWFSTTHWSTVLAAADRGSVQCAEALDKLCRTYWYPLYAHVRQRGYDAAEAEDLTQEFLARFLAKGYLADTRPDRGRFRFYLLTALNHFLADEWDRGMRQKRGGGVHPLRLDMQAGEKIFRAEPMDEASPDRLFERRWTLAMLNQVLGQLGEVYEAEDKGQLFRVLRGFLIDDPDKLSYAEAAAELSMSEGALRIAVHRLRRRYGELLRREVANTVSSPEEIEEELRHLLAVLSG